MTRTSWFCGVLVVMLVVASRPGLARAEPAAVLLDIRGSTDHVRVLQRDPSGREHAVCTGPCARSLDPGPEYVLETASPLMPATPPFTKAQLFTLPADRPSVRLEVTPVSKVRPAAGWSLLAVGVATVLVTMAEVLGDNPGGRASNLDTPSRYWVAGFPVGFASAGLGAYLLGTSSPRVTSDTGAVLQR